MRTIPGHIVDENGSGCPWCNHDHDPGIPCRYEPESVRFQIGKAKVKPPRKPPVRVTDATGKLVCVRTE